MSFSSMDWTVEKLAILHDDGKRYEVIDGELFVTPAPALIHQRAAGQLYVRLEQYARRLGIEALITPAAVTFSQRREVQPDVFVMPRNGDRLAERFKDVGRLVLAVEILSPGTTRVDRT